MSDAEVNSSDGFHCGLNGVDLNRGSGPHIITIETVYFRKDIFPFPYPYEFYCILIEEVPKTLRDVFEYGSYV